MKKIVYSLLLLLAVLGCVPELPVQPVPIDEGYPEGAKVTVRFAVSTGDVMPATKDLGETHELDSLYLAVFGSSGYLKEYVKAELLGDFRSSDTVQFKATLTLSDKERSIHFIGNGPSTVDFGYDTDILPELLSANGGQAFWQMKDNVIIAGNKEGDSYEPTAETMAQFQDIALIRNYARIELSADDSAYFHPEWYAVFNVPAKGAVVPFYNGGFIKDYQNHSFEGIADTLGYPGSLPDSTDFVQTPDQWDVLKVADNATVYMYERPVPTNEALPTYLIVYGEYDNPHDEAHRGDHYYYKIDFMEGGEYYPILRNFKYQIHINKILSIGHVSPEAAAASAGSADVSADIRTSHLNDISDGEARLVVQPWMAQTFIKKQTNNSVLHVKFFDDAMSSEPNMVYSAVRCSTLSMPAGQEDVIESFSIGYPYQASGTDKGWRTVTFTTKEPGAPGTPSRTQVLRISGTYKTAANETRTLYRDVQITLQPLQQMQLTVESPDDEGEGVPREMAKTIRLHVGIPVGLAESMFPIHFTIEPEDMSLTPDNQVDNNNLPVSANTSISDHAEYAGKRAFQFSRTLTYEEYKTLPQSLDLDGEPIRTFTCHFKTTRRDNATTIWVANEYFSKAHVSYSNTPAVKLRYFYVQAREDIVDNCTVKLQFNSGKVEYKKNDESWAGYSSNSNLVLKRGDRVYFRGNVKSWSGTDKFSVTGSGLFDVGGNIASLFRDNFTEEDLPEENWGADATGWTFQSFFQDETGLVDASKLVLPMSTMVNSGSNAGYRYMFQGCTNLTSAPALPASTLTTNCYQSMFQGCTQLTAAPALPVTTLASNCYESMFQSCTALTTAPKLLAETLVSNCYKNMFNGCSSLNEITMTARGTNISSYLTGWVTGVAPTGDFYAYVNSTLAVGNSGIPTGWVNRKDFYVEAVEAGTVKFDGTGLEYSKNWEDWTSEGINSISVSAGDIVRFRGVRSGGTISSTGNFNVAGNILSLAAEDYTSVTTGSFVGIFKDAEKLVSAADLVLPTTLQANCFNEMFSGCTSLTTPPTLSATTLAANCYKSMFSGCTSLTSAPALPATDLAANCYEAMFQNCTTLDATPTLPARTLAQECYKSMFAGCTNLTVSPQLPAETLVDGCYDNMFNGCSNLAKVYCSATTNLGNGFTTNWLADVAASGLFVKNEAATTWPQPSPNGIPDGWTIPWSGFKIRAITNTTITFNYNYSNSGIEYSLNEGKDWTPYTAAFDLSAGQAACIRGTRTNYKNDSGDQYGTPSSNPIFTANALCYISGNIMTLLSDQNNLSESAFHGAFSKGKTAVDYIDIDPESPLILPATTLPSKCYMQMFRNCTKLTRVPVFRAEVVNYRSCYNMFRDCIGLTSAEGIELPAMTLAIDCYRELFRGCTSLASAAPKLPAPTLVKECYRQMFSSTKITSLVCLATDISAENCTNEWMSGVTNNNSRTFYKASSMSVGDGGWSRDSHGIPSSWKVENYSGQ